MPLLSLKNDWQPLLFKSEDPREVWKLFCGLQNKLRKALLFKVGVNHGIFNVYHFWNFLIFKCTWVCSSSSSKNRNIFLNLSINSINSKMSIYLSISKMCLSLFSRENQACARTANAKRTTQSRDAALSAITEKERASPLNWRVDLGNQFASLKTTVKFVTFVEE